VGKENTKKGGGPGEVDQKLNEASCVLFQKNSWHLLSIIIQHGTKVFGAFGKGHKGGRSSRGGRQSEFQNKGSL